MCSVTGTWAGRAEGLFARVWCNPIESTNASDTARDVSRCEGSIAGRIAEDCSCGRGTRMTESRTTRESTICITVESLWCVGAGLQTQQEDTIARTNPSMKSRVFTI